MCVTRWWGWRGGEAEAPWNRGGAGEAISSQRSGQEEEQLATQGNHCTAQDCPFAVQSGLRPRGQAAADRLEKKLDQQRGFSQSAESTQENYQRRRRLQNWWVQQIIFK